jgi:hypothetical protein
MYLITTAERDGSDIHTHHTIIFSHTLSTRHRTKRRTDRTDDYRYIRQSSSAWGGFSLPTPPKSQRQVPAPACLLPTEFTLHYYTSHTPAHSRSERYNQLLTDCFPLPLTLNLSSSSIPRQQSPPPIRSPIPNQQTPTNTTMPLLTSTIPQEPSCARLPTL